MPNADTIINKETVAMKALRFKIVIHDMFQPCYVQTARDI